MRWIPDQIDRAKLRTTFTYRPVPRLSVGVEYNPLSDEDKVGPLLNVVAVQETKKRPALIFGTSSDRIGTPEGQAYFGTFSKKFAAGENADISPYAGWSYGTFEERGYVIGGLRADFGKRYATTFLWDGVNLHGTFDVRHGPHVFSFILAEMEDPGVAYSFAF